METGFTDGAYWVRGTLTNSGSHVWRGPYSNKAEAVNAASALWLMWDMDITRVPRDITHEQTANALELVQIGFRTWQAHGLTHGRWILSEVGSLGEWNVGLPNVDLYSVAEAARIKADKTPDNQECFGPFVEDYCNACDEQDAAIDALPPFHGQSAIQNVRFANAFTIPDVPDGNGGTRPGDGSRLQAPETWAADGQTNVLFDTLLPLYDKNVYQPYGRYLDNVRILIELDASFNEHISYGNGEPGNAGYQPIAPGIINPFDPEHWELVLSYIGKPFLKEDTESYGYTGYNDLRNRGVCVPVGDGPLNYGYLHNKLPIYNGFKSEPCFIGGPGENGQAFRVFDGSHTPVLDAYAGIRSWYVEARIQIAWDVVDAGGPVECHNRTNWFSASKVVFAESANQGLPGPYTTYPWDNGFFRGFVAPIEPADPDVQVRFKGWSSEGVSRETILANNINAWLGLGFLPFLYEQLTPGAYELAVQFLAKVASGEPYTLPSDPDGGEVYPVPVIVRYNLYLFPVFGRKVYAIEEV